MDGIYEYLLRLILFEQVDNHQRHFYLENLTQEVSELPALLNFGDVTSTKGIRRFTKAQLPKEASSQVAFVMMAVDTVVKIK